MNGGSTQINISDKIIKIKQKIEKKYIIKKLREKSKKI